MKSFAGKGRRAGEDKQTINCDSLRSSFTQLFANSTLPSQHHIPQLKLARLVGYIPVPVVGGYLAFIGYFCLQAGVALCISTPMSTISSWSSLFNYHSLILAIPGLATGLLFFYIAKKHASHLPALMCVVPLLFYLLIFLLYGPAAIARAREQGWVGKGKRRKVRVYGQ